MLKSDEIRQAVRETYTEVAKAGTGCGCDCGCGDQENFSPEDVSLGLGYSTEDVSTVLEGANMGLGCGNPQAIAALQTGETVIDLGSGGGFDSFLAVRAVGDSGRVIGIDMTPEMISKARTNAEKVGVTNVEFRLGEIEHLPVANNSVVEAMLKDAGFADIRVTPRDGSKDLIRNWDPGRKLEDFIVSANIEAVKP